jgi:cytochrome c oxidase cbb3-type subunit 3
MKARTPVAFAAFAAFAATLSVLVILAACDQVFPHRSEGEKLYRDNCAECHGLDAAGNTPGYMGNAYADLRDNLWRNGGDPDSMQAVVRDGVFGQMPKFDQLSQKEVREVVDYVRVLRGEKAPESAAP